MKTEELFEKAEIIVDEYFHEFTEGRLERDQMIDAIWKLAEQYHEARMKEELKKYYLWIDENYAMGMLCGNANAVVEEYLDKTNKGKGKTLKSTHN